MSKDSLSDWSTDQYGGINSLPQYTGSGEAIQKVINDLDRSNLYFCDSRTRRRERNTFRPSQYMSNSIKSSESSGACSPSPCNLDGFVTYVIIIGSMCDVRLYTFTGVSVRIQVLSGQVCGRDCNPYPGKYYTGYHSIFV